MEQNSAFYRRRLYQELQRRIERNPRYSIRSLAQALKTSPSALGQIMNGKRSISTRVMDRLLSNMELSEEERAHFVLSVFEEKSKSGNRKISKALRERTRLLKEASSSKRLQPSSAALLDFNQFQVISDWHHYAILELTFKRDFKYNSRWISKKLGITATEAALAMQRVKELGLIDKRDGRWCKTEIRIDTKDQTKTSNAHHRHQKQIIEKSLYSLENDPIEERNHSGVTFCADPDRIPEAKEKIRKFLWELTEFLEGEKPRRVYELNLQLFPLERKD